MSAAVRNLRAAVCNFCAVFCAVFRRQIARFCAQNGASVSLELALIMSLLVMIFIFSADYGIARVRAFSADRIAASLLNVAKNHEKFHPFEHDGKTPTGAQLDAHFQAASEEIFALARRLVDENLREGEEVVLSLRFIDDGREWAFGAGECADEIDATALEFRQKNGRKSPMVALALCVKQSAIFSDTLAAGVYKSAKIAYAVGKSEEE